MWLSQTVVNDICRHPDLATVCQDSKTLILYPGPKAKNLEELEEGELGNTKHNVILIDGTWSQAKNMFLKNNMFHLPKQVCYFYLIKDSIGLYWSHSGSHRCNKRVMKGCYNKGKIKRWINALYKPDLHYRCSSTGLFPVSMWFALNPPTCVSPRWNVLL